MKTYKKHFFGTRKDDDAKIYIDGPEWQCGWYWSFGYLGNAREHYHLSGYQSKSHFLKLEDGSHKLLTEKRNKCMYDCLKEDYDLNPKLLEGKSDYANNLWTFCELALSAYALKETAEVLGRGGSHMTSNPCQDVIKNNEEVKRINGVVLPAIFDAIEELFNK